MLRIGIVGMGLMGRELAKDLQEPWFNTLVAVGGVCDTSPAQLEAAANDFGAPPYESLDEMLQVGNLDAVYISTPDDCHRDPFVRSLEAGVAILVEKPLATTIADARAMLTAAESARRPVAVNFSNRFHSRYLTLKHAIDDGNLGDIRCIKGWLSNTQYVPLTMLKWASRSTCGWFLLSHVLDMTAWLTAAQPLTVFARGTKSTLLEKGIDTYDYLSALVEYDHGITGLYESAWILPEGLGRVVDTEYHVIGSKGCASVNIGSDLVSISTSDRTEWPRATNWRRDAFMGFFQDCEAGSLSSEPIRLGFDNTATLVALHEAVASGMPAKIESP